MIIFFLLDFFSWISVNCFDCCYSSTRKKFSQWSSPAKFPTLHTIFINSPSNRRTYALPTTCKFHLSFRLFSSLKEDPGVLLWEEAVLQLPRLSTKAKVKFWWVEICDKIEDLFSRSCMLYCWKIIFANRWCHALKECWLYQYTTCVWTPWAQL